MFPRAALVLAAILVTLVLALFIVLRWFGPFAIWTRQMAAGRTYMKSLKESDMPAWIERSKHLLAEYRPDVGPVGVYDNVTHGKPIPSDLAQLKIVRVDIFQNAVCYVWMGGMDHTFLEARRLPDGSITLVAHYNDYQSEVIWPKRPNQAMERTATGRAFAFRVATTFPLQAMRALGGRRSSCSR
jgi:hypothetical protein